MLGTWSPSKLVGSISWFEKKQRVSASNLLACGIPELLESSACSHAARVVGLREDGGEVP